MKRLFLNAFSLVAFILCAAALGLWLGFEYAVSAVVPEGRALPVVMRGQAGYLQIDCPPFQNVVATGKATVRLDNLGGYTIDHLILELGGTALTKAMLTNIKIYANEKPIFEDSGSNIDSRMQYRGIAANAAYLDLAFAEMRARTIEGQHAGSLDTISSGVNKLVLDVDITGATAPTLSAFALLSAGGQKNPTYNRLMSKVFSRTFNPGGAGEFAFDFSYARRPGCFVKRVHLIGATATAARVKKNGIEIWKATDARNDFVQTSFQRTPQANIITIDFMVDGNISEALPLENANSLEWYATASGAGNIVVVTELLDLLENN